MKNEDRFKFRVWYGADINYWIHDNDDYHVSIDLLFQDLCLKEWRSNGVEPDGFYDLPKEFATIEQCTGLKDVDGKFVYEGDIVYSYDEQKIGVVEFDIARFIISFPESCNDPYGDFKGEGWNDLYGDFKVIGNIHENPELLKE